MDETMEFERKTHVPQGMTPGTRNKPNKEPWQIKTNPETLRGFPKKKYVCTSGPHVIDKCDDYKCHEENTEKAVEDIYVAFCRPPQDTIPRTKTARIKCSLMICAFIFASKKTRLKCTNFSSIEREE